MKIPEINQLQMNRTDTASELCETPCTEEIGEKPGFFAVNGSILFVP